MSITDEYKKRLVEERPVRDKMWVENRPAHLINLITSFFAKELTKLGNEVLYIWSFIRATEVVLLFKLGKNEVFVTYPDGYGLKAFYNHV